MVWPCLAHGGAAPGMDSRNAGMEEHMKRIMVIMIALLFAATGSMVLAQASAAGPESSLDKSGSIREQSDLYPVRVDVVRVYAHSQGYRVVYRKGSASVADLYIPTSWFVPGARL